MTSKPRVLWSGGQRAVSGLVPSTDLLGAMRIGISLCLVKVTKHIRE